MPSRRGHASESARTSGEPKHRRTWRALEISNRNEADQSRDQRLGEREELVLDRLDDGADEDEDRLELELDELRLLEDDPIEEELREEDDGDELREEEDPYDGDELRDDEDPYDGEDLYDGDELRDDEDP